jgi:CelD/BcsL family acetyltransferase involved in cellulose biosynthesis
MTIALRDSPAGSAMPAAAVQVDVLRDIAAAEGTWRGLEQGGALFTPYQRYDWVRAWQHHIGARLGYEPLIVVGRDATGTPVFLWPLALRSLGGLRTATWFGGKHANLNMGLWRRNAAERAAASDVAAIFDHLAREHKVALLVLANQPKEWDGIANPFLNLPWQDSVGDNFALTLSGSIDDVLKRLFSANTRSRWRNKERKLAQLEGYRYHRVETSAEVGHYLGVFLQQKAVRLQEKNLGNVFAEPGVEHFIRECCRFGLDDGHPLIELHVLEGDGEILALFSGVHNGRRFSSMFNSYTLGENARRSPGAILLHHILANLVERGFRSFDLGLGDAHYKSLFCPEAEPLFDNFIALKQQAIPLALAMRASYAAKRRMKQSPLASSLIEAARRVRSLVP